VSLSQLAIRQTEHNDDFVVHVYDVCRQRGLLHVEVVVGGMTEVHSSCFYIMPCTTHPVSVHSLSCCSHCPSHGVHKYCLHAPAAGAATVDVCCDYMMDLVRHVVCMLVQNLVRSWQTSLSFECLRLKTCNVHSPEKKDNFRPFISFRRGGDETIGQIKERDLFAKVITPRPPPP